MGLRGPRSRGKKQREEAPARKRRAPWEAPGLTRAERVIAFCESLPVTKGLLAGQPMKLLPHQREFIEHIYAEDSPVRLAIQSVPRGNGKTGLLAALALAHLLGPESEPRGEVYCAAIDLKQAGILFAEVVAMIEAVPAFEERVNIIRFHRKIEVLGDGPGKGSIFETLSSDVRRGHGLAASFWVYDEFAQAKTGELFDNLLTGGGKRKRSLGVVISTQAGRDEHPLSVLIDDAQRGLDASVYLQLLAAGEDDDPFNESTWKRVNPAWGIFLNEIEFRAQARRAQRVSSFENKFKNLRLNMRVSAAEHWIDLADWSACAGTVDDDALDGPCYGGLDLASVRDLTAFALFWPDSGALKVWTWCPAQGVELREARDKVPYRTWGEQGWLEVVAGAAIDKDAIARRLAELCAIYKPEAVAFDKWGMAELQKYLDDHGINLPLEPWGQGFRDMAPASDAFEQRVLSKKLRHDRNPILTWCLSNVVMEQDSSGNRKPNKRRSTDRIDAVIAAVMAVGISTTGETAGSVYDQYAAGKAEGIGVI